jgi:hypothetical protein
LARGEELDISEYSTLTSTLVRVAQRIGLGRVAKDIIPTLQEYILMTPVERAKVGA